MMKAIAFKRNLLIGVILLSVAVLIVPGDGLANGNDGLVGYWNFDEGRGTTVHDLSGNGNDGTIQGGATWTIGISGSALEFDGSDDYIQANPVNATNYLTVSVWAKYSYFFNESGGHAIVSNGEETPQQGYMLYQNTQHPNNRVTGRVYAGGDSDWLPVQEEALFQQITEFGPVLVHQRGISYDRFLCTQEVPTLLNPFVVWSNYLANAVYTTTSNTVDGHVFAGTCQNPPKVAQLFALDGGGTPEWMYSGNEFYIDAGDKAFTLAAVDFYSTGVNVIKWTGPGSGTPDWTNNLIGYSGTTYGPVAVSDDGSTIAVLLSYSSMTHLLLFGSDSPTPIANYATSGFPRIVRTNSDGRFTIFRAGTDILVYDKNSLSLRDQIATGFSSSALDISGNGDLIAYGWQSLVVLQWNGSDYQELWSWRPSGYYLSACAISSDGTTIVSGWYEPSYTSAKVAAHLVGSSTPLWVYDYTRSSGVYQEMISDIETTDDGNYCIVGSWGDADNLNPEVHIFRRDSIPPLYYTVDMPGSVYSVDISGNGAYATACGKHVHANELGRGGDVVMVQTFLRGDANGDGVINVSDVVYLINYLYISGPAPQPLGAGDVNCDGVINGKGVVNISDVVYLINYLFLVPPGPPPGC